MTKGKKWTLRLLGVAVLALLVSLCLMGSTMARYTSKGDGSGTLTVALWDVETAELNIDGDAVSPSDEEYGKGTGTITDGARENVSGWVGSFTIVNNSDVSALVTFDAGSEYTITWPDDDSLGEEKQDWEWGTGWTNSNLFDGNTGAPLGKAQTNEYGKDLMNHFGTGETNSGETAFESIVNGSEIFSLQFGFGLAFDTENTEPDSVPTAKTDTITLIDETYLTENKGVPVKSGESVNIYAEVVWTSITCTGEEYKADNNPNLVEDFTDAAEYSDAVDTILGMYAQKLTFSVTWTAVQNSTLPAATQEP